MRYQVKKVDGGYEFTHIETREGLDGKDVDVIKGRNILTIEKIEAAINGLEDELKEYSKENIDKNIRAYKEDAKNNIQLRKDQIECFKKMVDAIRDIQ